MFLLPCRNSCVTMGASLTAPEYSLKVADVSKVRSFNAIAKNTLWIESGQLWLITKSIRPKSCIQIIKSNISWSFPNFKKYLFIVIQTLRKKIIYTHMTYNYLYPCQICNYSGFSFINWVFLGVVGGVVNFYECGRQL